MSSVSGLETLENQKLKKKKNKIKEENWGHSQFLWKHCYGNHLSKKCNHCQPEELTWTLLMPF